MVKGVIMVMITMIVMALIMAMVKRIFYQDYIPIHTTSVTVIISAIIAIIRLIMVSKHCH